MKNNKLTKLCANIFHYSIKFSINLKKLLIEKLPNIIFLDFLLLFYICMYFKLVEYIWV